MNRKAKEREVNQLTIGWREYVDLPDWNMRGVKTKADTGARTSAIDVADIELIDDHRVRFTIVGDRDSEVHRETVEANVLRRTRVKSSFGAARDRIIVRTRMRIGSVEKEIELGLVCRKNMLCRMLLGRAALEPHFVVDPSRKYVFGRKRPRKRKGGAS